jgi:hypothetical protein
VGRRSIMNENNLSSVKGEKTNHERVALGVKTE